MNYLYTLVSVFLVLSSTLQAAPQGPQFTEVMQKSGSRIGWLSVPERNDSVLVNIDQAGKLTYINPDLPNPKFALPAGLFFWQSDNSKPSIQRSTRNSIVRIKPQGRPFSWDSSKNVYYSQVAPKTVYTAGRFSAPSRSVALWIHAGNTKLGVSAVQSKTTVPTVVAAIKEGKELLNRKLLFDDVMGISEDAFRRAVSIPKVANYKITADKAQEVKQWFEKNFAEKKLNPRAQAVYLSVINPPQIKTLAELRSQAYQKLINSCVNPNHQLGTLTLLIHDQNQLEKTDIRGMHDTMPGAWFQTASNFNSLEGGMGDYRNNLSDMNEHAVQGEEAALSTMGAAIYLRYFVPTAALNLLSGLGNVLDIDLSGSTPVVSGKKPGAFLDDAQLGALKVVVQKDIAVTSGYWPELENRAGKNRPKYNTRVPVVGQGSYTVTHVITSAVNLMGKDKQALAQISQWLLKGAYEATLLAAVVGNAKTLVLTLVGGGAFRNDFSWISDAISRLQPIIVASGIDVRIVVRAEDPKTQAEWQAAMEVIKKKIDDQQAQFLAKRQGLCEGISRFFGNPAVATRLQPQIKVLADPNNKASVAATTQPQKTVDYRVQAALLKTKNYGDMFTDYMKSVWTRVQAWWSK